MDDRRIVAAGGLLWRDASRAELCVIHRHRYRDWCLPKGKLEPGETFAAAALREVEEETGYRAGIAGYAGEILYKFRSRWKSVLYFHMVCEAPDPVGPVDPEEVAEVVWMPLEDARARLDHDNERGLLP